MAYNSQTRAALQAHITEHGLGNIVFHEVLGSTGPTVCALMCSVCCYQVQWAINPNEPLGIELELLTGFCKNHLHGKKPFPKLSQPNFDSDETHITASALKAAVDKMKADNMIVHPQVIKDLEEDGDPFNLMGEIKVHTKRVVAISSEAIRQVAKHSNFNVDVQAKGIQYRGYCSQCGNEIKLQMNEILALDKGQFTEAFKEFLSTHKHDGSDKELPKGRKFRHASQQG